MHIVTVRTAEKSNTAQGGNEDKFYRTFELPTVSVMQWGSQRNGRSGGQYKISSGPGDASMVFNKKLTDGYVRVSVEEFELDPAGYNLMIQTSDAKTIGASAERAYDQAKRTGKVKTSSGNVSTGGTPPKAPFRGTPKAATPAAPASPTTVQKSNAAITEINTLAAEALGLMKIAAVDPIKALKKLPDLRNAQEAVVMATAKLSSYLETIDEMIEENAI